MDEEQRQLLRLLANIELQGAMSGRDLIMKEIITSLRWVQTSLLVVNGGAAVAMLESEAVGAPARTYAGAGFGCGIALALLTAIAGVRAGKDAPKRFSGMAGYWTSVSVDLLRSEEIEREWYGYAAQIEKRGKLAQGLGYASFFCFLVGSAIIGLLG